MPGRFVSTGASHRRQRTHSPPHVIRSNCCTLSDAGHWSAAEAREVHQAGGLPVGFLDSFDDVRRVRRVFELDGDGAVDAQFLDRLKIRLEFDDAAAGRQIAVDFAVAIADVDMDGSVFELGQINRASVGQYEVADVDIGAHARVAALVQETLVGALTISRTVTDPALSKAILREAANSVSWP